MRIGQLLVEECRLDRRNDDCPVHVGQVTQVEDPIGLDFHGRVDRRLVGCNRERVGDRLVAGIFELQVIDLEGLLAVADGLSADFGLDLDGRAGSVLTEKAVDQNVAAVDVSPEFLIGNRGLVALGRDFASDELGRERELHDHVIDERLVDLLLVADASLANAGLLVEAFTEGLALTTDVGGIHVLSPQTSCGERMYGFITNQ